MDSNIGMIMMNSYKFLVILEQIYNTLYFYT